MTFLGRVFDSISLQFLLIFSTTTETPKEPTLLDGARPVGQIIERNGVAVQVPDGARGADGRVWGCYLHGIFENDDFRHSWLRALGWQGAVHNMAALRQREYDRLADAVEAAMGWSQIAALIGPQVSR